jgi:hypothetical protein
MMNIPELETPVGVAGHSVQKNKAMWVAVIVIVVVKN